VGEAGVSFWDLSTGKKIASLPLNAKNSALFTRDGLLVFGRAGLYHWPLRYSGESDRGGPGRRDDDWGTRGALLPRTPERGGEHREAAHGTGNCGSAELETEDAVDDRAIVFVDEFAESLAIVVVFDGGPEVAEAGKESWQTEMYDRGLSIPDTGMGSALRVVQMIHDSLTIVNMNAWHFWWIVRSLQTKWLICWIGCF